MSLPLVNRLAIHVMNSLYGPPNHALGDGEAQSPTSRLMPWLPLWERLPAAIIEAGGLSHK
jgi:hypothetical protein